MSELFTAGWTTEEQMGDFKTKEVKIRFPSPAGPDVRIHQETAVHG